MIWRNKRSGIQFNVKTESLNIEPIVSRNTSEDVPVEPMGTRFEFENTLNSTDSLETSYDAIAIRMVDDDPFCVTQRALFKTYKDDKRLIPAIVQLKERLNAKEVYLVVSETQKMSALKEIARIYTVNENRYPQSLAAYLRHGIPSAFLKKQNNSSAFGVFDLSVVLHEYGVLTSNHVMTVCLPTKTKVVEFELGITAYQLLETLGEKTNWKKIVFGSPLLGQAVYDDKVIPRSVLALSVFDDIASIDELNLPCCNCGFCTKVCPRQLIPSKLSKVVEFKRTSNGNALRVSDCIECGCCDVVCPSKRQIVEQIQLLKTKGMS